VIRHHPRKKRKVILYTFKKYTSQSEKMPSWRKATIKNSYDYESELLPPRGEKVTEITSKMDTESHFTKSSKQ